MASVPPTQAVEPEIPPAPPVEEPDHAPPDWFEEEPEGESLPEALLAAGPGAGLPAKIKRKANSQHGIGEPKAYEIYCRPVGIGGTPPWCVYFLAWCWRQATGKSQPHAPWENVTFPGFGHTQEVHDWAKQHDKLAQKPASGMLFGIEDGFAHTGLILGVNAQTLELWTINGNWGNKVANQTWKHVRGRKWKYGSNEHTLFFVRL